MNPDIPLTVADTYSYLDSQGFSVYLVGGCVRNLLMDIPVNDWDVATNASPEQIQELYPESYYENTYGTVKVPFDEEKKEFIEITTFRSESEYKDSRHPESVTWGQTIEEDLARRDFTCNAIAMQLTNRGAQFMDPHGGQEDIKRKIIQAVGNPDERFKEDALRLMRAIRFAAQLKFSIEEKTWDSIKRDCQGIQNISWERIRDELLKILASELPEKGIMLLDEAGLLEYILPELVKGKGVNQERPGRHHVYDVYTHNLMALRYTPSTDPIVRLATLLHDVGKPEVEATDENGHVIFYNHEVVGAKIASNIAERLKLSKKQREKIYTLIRWHMFSVDETVTDHAVRKFLRRVGVENVKDMIDLRFGDRLGSGTKTAESWRLKRFKEMIEKELNPPFSINDLAINGTDIMKELQIKPGRKVGEILKKLFEEVDEDLSRNNRDYLLKKMQELV
jgi:putative nucleotidyltransferase with HDIG domain